MSLTKQKRAHFHRHDSLPQMQRRALWLCLILNSTYMVVELVGGLIFNSLALLADSAHMLSDVAGLTIALIAQDLVRRPATERHTYGLKRADVMGALLNGGLLVVTTAWILIEAVQRFSSPQEVQGLGLIGVATVGLGVNLVSAAILARSRGRSLNMQGAFLHMVSDAAGSLVAIAAGVAALAWSAYWVDPAGSILIAMLILWATWRLLGAAALVLMEGTPAGLDPKAVEGAIEAQTGVQSVHHLHLWSVASDMPALSAHVLLEGEVSLHQAQERGDEIRAMLAARFEIEHATLELECHECEPERHSSLVDRHQTPIA